MIPSPLFPSDDAKSVEAMVYHTQANHRLDVQFVLDPRMYCWRPRGWSQKRAQRAFDEAEACGLLVRARGLTGEYYQSTREPTP